MLWWLVACGPEEPAPIDEEPVPSCAELAPDDVLEPDAGGPDTQIHASSAADATGVWVAWNRPDDAGLFDVWLAHLACDGAVDVGPVQVDDSSDNEIDPGVAVSGDRVLVAWQSDNGGYPDNLDVRWRVLDLDGQPVSAVHEVEGPGNAWMPAAAGTPDGFVIAGSRSNGAVFAGFWAEVDLDGLASGPVDVSSDPGQGEFWPSVSVGDDVWVAWEGDSGASSLDVGGTVADYGLGVAPSISAVGSEVWVGFGDGVSDLFLVRPGQEPAPLKGGAAVQHSIAVATGADGGGHAAWYQNISGLANELKVGRFDADGALLDTVDLGAEQAAPYGLNVTRIDDDTVFVAWQEGTSPAFRLRGRFVRL